MVHLLHRLYGVDAPGVPQGSVLGPTLFLLFINDVIFSHLDVSFKLFADDKKLYSCYDITCADDFCIAIKRLCDWSTVWQLNIAVEKCLHVVLPATE